MYQSNHITFHSDHIVIDFCLLSMFNYLKVIYSTKYISVTKKNHNLLL